MANITVVKESENPLLGRKEIVLKCKNPQKSTPKTAEVMKSVSEFLKKDQDTIAMKRIAQDFGLETCTVEVFVYAKKDIKDQVETINKKKKKGEQEEAPAKKKE